MRKTSRIIVSCVIGFTISACHNAAVQPGSAGTVVSAGLNDTQWQLVEFQSMDDSQGISRPNDPAKYTISFGSSGRVWARLDCNRASGPWRADAAGGMLTIGPLASTKALCPKPSIGEFLKAQLGYVRSYTMSQGRLNMALMADGGILVWEPIDEAK